MARKILIWIGATLEIAAVVTAGAWLLVDPPAARVVLLTQAVVLGLCGISLQVLAAEVHVHD